MKVKRHICGIGAIGLLLILSGSGAASVHANLLHLEDPLSSHQMLLPERHRLTLGSEYFGATNWTGLRNSFRYEACRGELLDWVITLPWLYSSWNSPGHGGRDNLHLGGSIKLFGPGRGYCRLATDFWMAFSADDLYPLQQRRAYGRLSFHTNLDRGGFKILGAVAFRREMVGMGGEAVGVWPQRWSALFRLGRAGLELDGLFLKAGLSTSPEGPTWWNIGCGYRARLQDMWRFELAVDTSDSRRAEPEMYDYRISISLSREIFKVSNTVLDTDLDDEDEESDEDYEPLPPGSSDGSAGEEPAAPAETREQNDKLQEDSKIKLGDS
ncbi:MAG: hypothetical protein GY835_15660 [bacterium]|nr:hypothetical protein [bacterium]